MYWKSELKKIIINKIKIERFKRNEKIEIENIDRVQKRLLRKFCESEEGWDKTPIFYLISLKSYIFGWAIQVESCSKHHWSHYKAD